MNVVNMRDDKLYRRYKGMMGEVYMFCYASTAKGVVLE